MWTQHTTAKFLQGFRKRYTTTLVERLNVSGGMLKLRVRFKSILNIFEYQAVVSTINFKTIL